MKARRTKLARQEYQAAKSRKNRNSRELIRTSAFQYRLRNEMVRRLGFSDYSHYLQSPLWEAISRRCLERDKFCCYVCGGTANEVHHAKYTWENLQRFIPGEVFSVCRRCHHRIEFGKDGQKRFG